jgi:hypothetical protein
VPFATAGDVRGSVAKKITAEQITAEQNALDVLNRLVATGRIGNYAIARDAIAWKHSRRSSPDVSIF